MKKLIDVINFNGDASCLSSADWLSHLQGKEQSNLCRWLNGYVKYQKQIVLGLTGSSIADICRFNPEAIKYINNHPEIFQIILRPFSHDIALLRSDHGFALNFSTGRKVIEKELENHAPFYLPPEFMLTGQQIHALSRKGVQGTFLNPQRFSDDIQRRLPRKPYQVRGVLGAYLCCIPCDGRLTGAYLNALYGFDAIQWNRALAKHPLETVYTWRDGESAFLIPDGIEREASLLKNESEQIKRSFLPNLSELGNLHTAAENDRESYRSYPVHSFSDWMKEFRMLGYIQKLTQLEKSLNRLSSSQLAVWFSAIGSDVLSAVEKRDRVINLFSQDGKQHVEYRIVRCDRGFEGEDYLTVLENLIQGQEPAYLRTSSAPHMTKLRARMAYLEKLSLEDLGQ